jgi:DnaK suppressor protein
VPHPTDDETVRAVLSAAEADLTAQVSALSRDLRGIVDAADLVATDDEHDPEGATLAFERAQSGALLAQARARLAEVRAARDRLAAGTYGHCTRCGAAITPERLAARPATPTCIHCAH